ncbi:MAG: hypothetical protein HYY02_09150 [Chloroflexi bacterium]|nr:hypothetical protein [Chloroflexota bacterium]
MASKVGGSKDKRRSCAGRGELEALQYHILREEYVLGMSTRHIMVRHSVSESTFHRYRRDAIVALAGEMARQEELISLALEKASGAD